MSIVDKFGEKVGEIAENDPVKARKLLLAGYRLQEKRLALFPDRKLPMSGQYVAKIVMNNIIQALAKPENAAILLWCLHRIFLFRPMPSRCVPTVLIYHSTGISTCCPSATSSDLALGPDLPRADQLYPGNLGYSAEKIPTSLSLLIPAFSLQDSPPLLPVWLHSVFNAPLPIITDSRASVSCFSPGHFRRRMWCRTGSWPRASRRRPWRGRDPAAADKRTFCAV